MPRSESDKQARGERTVAKRAVKKTVKKFSIRALLVSMLASGVSLIPIGGCGIMALVEGRGGEADPSWVAVLLLSTVAPMLISGALVVISFRREICEMLQDVWAICD